MRFITLTLALVLFVAGIAIGFKLGANSRAKTDVAITTDLLVQIHQRIENGNATGARNLAEIGLLGNLHDYELLERDFFARAIYGKNIINTETFKKHLEEAMSIRKEALTNLVWFNSIGSTNSPSEK